MYTGPAPAHLARSQSVFALHGGPPDLERGRVDRPPGRAYAALPIAPAPARTVWVPPPEPTAPLAAETAYRQHPRGLAESSTEQVGGGWSQKSALPPIKESSFETKGRVRLFASLGPVNMHLPQKSRA